MTLRQAVLNMLSPTNTAVGYSLAYHRVVRSNLTELASCGLDSGALSVLFSCTIFLLPGSFYRSR